MGYDSDAEFFNAAKEAAIYNQDSSSGMKKVLMGFMFICVGAASVVGFDYVVNGETSTIKNTIVMGVSHIEESHDSEPTMAKDVANNKENKE